MKNVILLFIFLAIGCASLGTSAQKKLTTTLLATTVKVVIPNRGHGSGTVIRTNHKYTYILTNRHVCNGALIPFLGFTPVFIEGINISQEGTVVAVAEDADLCIVRAEKGLVRTARISNTLAELGDHVITVGNPMAVNNFITDGYVGEYTLVWGMLFQATSLAAHPGQSGSGVFNDDAELVGVVTYGVDGAPQLSGMVPLRIINGFLASFNFDAE